MSRSFSILMSYAMQMNEQLYIKIKLLFIDEILLEREKEKKLEEEEREKKLGEEKEMREFEAQIAVASCSSPSHSLSYSDKHHCTT